MRAAFRRCAAPLAAGLLALPLAAGAWSGQQHIQINKAAGRNVPEEMAAFREFARPMALPGIYPDLWKESDPDEGPRHYFEPDRLPPGTDLRALSPVQIEAFLQMEVMPDVRTQTGLQEVFKSVFPIDDFAGRGRLEFVQYELEEPK